jgi:uncharacterized protein YihD (DUF1040 family)
MGIEEQSQISNVLIRAECNRDMMEEGYSTMNNHRQNELLDAVAQLQQRDPDWRLGQLIANVAGWADQEIWDVEDEQLVAAAQLHLNQAVTKKAIPCQTK